MTEAAQHIVPGNFESSYLRLRQKEGRIYTDEEVRHLPNIDPAHPHYKEWQIRKDSSQKLIDHLKKRKQLTDILEIGCGNGWLSHQLSFIAGSRVIGTDINSVEIKQAERVFHDISNLRFIHGDTGSFEDQQFHIIVFAASIQYFDSLPEVIETTLKMLRPNGEIHIIGSPFYTASEIDPAKQRSIRYYQAAGFPEMANWYFHHSLEDLEPFNYSICYDPNNLFNKFLRNKNPFHWICIQH